MLDGLKKKIAEMQANKPSPEAIKNMVAEGQIWKSIFRHGYPDTPRNRIMAVLSNVFLHLHPVKARHSGIKMSYTWCMGGLSFFLFLNLTVTGVLLMFYYRPTAEYAYYDIIALRDSQIAYMPRATFMWLLDSSIEFNRFLLVQLNERLGQFIAMVEHDRLLGPDARVARCLATMFNPYLYPGNGPLLQISQEELSYLAGLSRQRVNQSLKQLENAKLLRIEYGGITVLDLEGLKQFHH